MRYEPAYDGMRAFAITSVVIYHVSRDYLPGGWAGVDVFFVLSGYLITKILTDELFNTGHVNIKAFYMRRVYRLVPALLFLYAFILLTTFIFPQELYNNLVSMIISILYLMNWNRAFDLFPQGVLGHTWSLSIEGQFYMLWPFLLIYFTSISRRLRYSIIIFILSLIIVWRFYLSNQGVDDERIYNGFDTHSDGLLLGCFVALINKSPRIIELASSTIIIPLTGLAYILIRVPHHSSLSINIGFALVSFFAAWIIIALEKDNFVRKVLSIKSLVYTGKISYGWYLWHYPIWCLVTLNISNYFERSLYMNITILFFSYLMAVISYHFIEKPFLCFKKKYQINKID